MFRVVKRYKRKLESHFKKQVDRGQFNIMLDSQLAALVKATARRLEVPTYVLSEHLLQLGVVEVMALMQDEALTERLGRHLLDQHLLVAALDPEPETTTQRVRRISNVLNLLEMLEITADPQEQTDLIRQFATSVLKRQPTRWTTSEAAADEREG